MVKKLIQANLQIKTTAQTDTAAQPSAGTLSARSIRPKRPALDRGGRVEHCSKVFYIFYYRKLTGIGLLPVWGVPSYSNFLSVSLYETICVWRSLTHGYFISPDC